MRIFGGEQVSKLMDLLKVPEDQPLEAGMVSRAIETAQRKVESHYFDMRKSVVEYDDVVNKQREIIYKLRLDVMSQGEEDSQKLRDRIKDLLDDQVEEIVNLLAAGGITEDETNSLLQNFYLILPLEDKDQKAIKKLVAGERDPRALGDKLWDIVDKTYDNKAKRLGAELMSLLERTVYLTSIDQLWMEHLDALDDLRDGIRLRGFAQKDPLVEYKHEAYGLFEGLINRINNRITGQVLRLEPQLAQKPTYADHAVAVKADASTGEVKPVKQAPARPTIKEPGRNDPCPCGAINPNSGKPYKYKNCGMINAPYHRG
jgi:preprotein translocase subunit SecA